MPLFRAMPAAVALLVLSFSHSFAAEKTAPQLLPASVAGYVEIARPKELIGNVLEHPLARLVEQSPEYQQALQSPEYVQYQEVVKAVEAKLGMPLRQAVETLAAEGITIAGDLATRGVVVLVRSSDAACTVKARDALIELARADATSKGKVDPISQDEHRGIVIHQAEEIRLAVHEDWLIASNKSLLLRAVLNNLLDEEAISLAGDAQFQKLYKDRPADAAVWSYVDLRLIRTTGILSAALAKKSDNPGIELLAGGILGALPDAPYVTGSLTFDKSRLALKVALPANVKKIAKQREFFVGPEGQGRAPSLLEPKETVISLATFRDFGSLWRNAPDLFNEEVNAKFAEAETGLSTLFSGRNFRDEILGNLEPGLQIVVARQDFAGQEIVPAMKLPAVAVVVRMKDPKETSKLFKITFQSAIGFLNVVGGMNGLDPLDVNSERQGDLLVVAAQYLEPKEEAVRKAAPPHFNASPTAVFVEDHFVLSSSKQLALEVADLLQKKPEAQPGVNTSVKSGVEVLGKILDENRDPLIAQNMLEKGHDRAAAEKEIDAILAVLKAVKSSLLHLMADENAMSLEWDVRFK